MTRPINNDLMISINDFSGSKDVFVYAMRHIKDIKQETETREAINRFIYTCRQSIGATLDALPSGESNTARKINGDLFERYILIILAELGMPVRDGIVLIPVVVNGEKLFQTPAPAQGFVRTRMVCRAFLP